jgi:7,8-dihydroneopterin aldolase/epimerase/oxygenase
MDSLILRELHFSARHGLLPIEAENEQPFSATVELELPLANAGTADRLDQTVDYRTVQSVVRDVLEGSRKHLIETLAERIAAELLRAFPQVRAVSVEVLKPRPPVDFQFAGVAVRIRRERPAPPSSGA